MKLDKTYWDNKLKAYLHDPIDKIFKIQGHENRAKNILEIFGLYDENDGYKEGWKTADIIASGFERGVLPSYKQNKNIAIDFLKYPVLTHPSSKSGELNIKLPENLSIDDIHKDLLDFLKEEIGENPNEKSFSNKFKGDTEKFAIARFMYLHLALRFQLADKNIGKVGALWHRLPADSRFPDHSIWQHNSLVSAFNSSMNGKGVKNIGIGVFSITPVQPFIAKARKLRDFWTGSVLLSWLAFEGIKWVIENLGPDHILYPSLIDQPLVNEYLSKEWKIDNVEWFNNQARDIASFPNKFLFVLPFEEQEDIKKKIVTHIKNKWIELTNGVKEKIISISQYSEEEIRILNNIFTRQNENYWEFNFATVKLLNENDKNNFSALLPKSYYENNIKLFDKFKEILNKNNWDKKSEGVLYSVTHSLAQSILASQKGVKQVKRKPENGEKCHLCNEFEVLNTFNYPKGFEASKYKKDIKNFWSNLSKNWKEKEHKKHDFNENEKLCSVCLTKRIANIILEKDDKHILNKTFKNNKNFPSTTEIALYNYYKRENIDSDDKKEIAGKLHNSKDDNYKKVKDNDKYYAVLMMDGDKMGELVNGKNLYSTWKSVIHPEIIERMKTEFNVNDISKLTKEKWDEIFEDYSEVDNNGLNKRLLTPSIHAAISESLGDFALYGVKSIIDKYDGKLIYAGGDDVAAILPTQNVLKVANEIQKYYTSKYKFIDKEGKIENVDTEFDLTNNKSGKLSINLGKGEKLSISAGILICHHKENLSEMIAKSHSVLNKAKDSGRNACAIELKKRSGGSRYFVKSWSDKNIWNTFNELVETIGKENLSEISRSFIYKLEMFRSGVEAILENENRKNLLLKFFTKELKDSGLKKDKTEDYAKKVYDLTIFCDTEKKKYKFSNEGLIITSFLAKGGE